MPTGGNSARPSGPPRPESKKPNWGTGIGELTANSQPAVASVTKVLPVVSLMLNAGIGAAWTDGAPASARPRASKPGASEMLNFMAVSSVDLACGDEVLQLLPYGPEKSVPPCQM